MMEASLADRARSGAQLGLTILSVLLAMAAYGLVLAGMERQFDDNAVAYAVIFGVGYLAGHIAIRLLAPRAEPSFFPAAGLLAGLGVAVIFRLDQSFAADQAYWLALGIVAFIATLVVVRDHRRLDAYTYSIGLLGVILLLLPIVPGLGEPINGAQVWIDVGGLSFQPAEIGKILIAIFLASYLSTRREVLAMAQGRLGPFRVPAARHLGPVLVAWGISLLILLLEKDLGTSLLYFAIFVVMLWLATARVSYLLIGLVLFAAGTFIAYQAFDHVEDRVVVWQHALEPQFLHDEGFQIAQSEFALASGGLAGTGLGRGQPGEIPFAETDMIFAAIGEELGLVGTVGVLLLYLLLVGKGFVTALDQKDGFGKLLAAGLTAILGLQAFIIIGGVTRVIPLTGITTPFVSYGGSSLVSNFILLALLVRISAGPAPDRRRRRLARSAEKG
jgi:cell division protein FtsW (lipid II flippase)